jgi:asparagine synthase (glutamine-hydrolysing)
MCGILAILNSSEPENEIRKRALQLSSKLRHRGPDWNGICIQHIGETDNKKQLLNILCHERLAIVGTDSGAQPLYNENGTIALTVNGEIYNYKKIQANLKKAHEFYTDSDCEVIVHLFEEMGVEKASDIANLLDGMFAFVISNKEKKTWFAARDPIGILPLYYGFAKDGSVWFSSELKALSTECDVFEEFPPGHYWSSITGKPERWYLPAWWDEHIPSNPIDYKLLRDTLDKAVVKCMMTDVPYGVLLSGGLDSSLIASIASRHAAKRVEENEQSGAWYPQLHSFSVGLKGAPDLKYAKEVANFLGTIHHEFHFTVQEGIDALRDVIYMIESYDRTTVRASTPMYLLARKVKAMGFKMVLSGEGSDEIFGGYLYFHKAPSKEALHKETCTKLKLLSKYDCLRANKSTSAWGVEVRPPFLDKDFLDVAMSIDPQEKLIKKNEGRMEKYIIRKAFDTPEKPYLPESILWRQKEQFSDGVGYNWIDSLRAYAEKEVSDEQMKSASFRFAYNPPATKEDYLYRSIFHSFFPQDSAAKTVPGGPSIACSTPAALEWEKAWKDLADPSGRSVLGVHITSDKKE